MASLQRTLPDPSASLAQRSVILKCSGAVFTRPGQGIDPMFHGQLLAIQIADAAAASMQPRDTVEAVPGQGLVGDRYAARNGKYPPDDDGNVLPKREVTLIESETLAAILYESGAQFLHANTRRNLLTENVPLNHLVGRSFSIGEVELRGVELCEPCGYLESMHPGIMKPLVHRGGLRAQIIRGGTLRVGDPIQYVD